MNGEKRKMKTGAHASFLALAACLSACSALAAGPAWFGGGNYDGYDSASAQASLGNPAVDNAGGATNVLLQSAWLNGTLVDTGSAATVVYVYWGVTDGGTNKGSWGISATFGTCVAGQALTTNITGLASNTAYYYRFYGTNSAGDEGWAIASASFITPGSPSVNNGPGATPVGIISATLNGILTNCPSAGVYIYWGQNTNAWSKTNSLGVSSAGPFSLAVSWLSAGTLYYYRCYATNDYGTAWSDPAAFTTTGAPPTSPACVTGGGYDGYDTCVKGCFLNRLTMGTVFVVH